MNREERIFEKISKNIKCDNLKVVNNSYLHKGHMGDDGTLETHYKVIIDSPELAGMSRVNAHKAVNKALKDEFEVGLHALEIEIVK